MIKHTDTKPMKVALVHDWLNTKLGGAERTLIELSKIYPDAPIYTLLYDEAKFSGLISPSRVRTSGLQKYPYVLRSHSRYLLPLIPKAVESFDFSDYDVVISNSSAFVKNIITKPSTYHICYCNSPMRFAWDYWPKYLDEQKVGPLRSYFIRKQVGKLRVWDFYGSARVDKWIANSNNVARRISKYYRKTSDVIYPPVNTALFKQNSTDKHDYFVTMSAHTPYKKLDLAIETFNQRGDKLIVLGEGPERVRLEKQAKPNVHFKGYISESERAKTLSGAKALIFPGEEDFGIAMVEALAAGTPVIAFNKGGAQEIVSNNKTGILFNKQTSHSLHQAIEALEKLEIKDTDLKEASKKFDSEVFRDKIVSYINKVVSQNVTAK